MVGGVSRGPVLRIAAIAQRIRSRMVQRYGFLGCSLRGAILTEVCKKYIKCELWRKSGQQFKEHVFNHLIGMSRMDCGVHIKKGSKRNLTGYLCGKSQPADR